MIQQLVASALGVGVGIYHHMVGSLHLYEKDWDKAALVVAEAPTVTWRPETPALPPVPDTYLSPIPDVYKAMFTAMTLMAKHAQTNEELISWVTMSNFMPEPWQDFLNVLAYRFHKDLTHVPNPWHELIDGRIKA
jgi:hypothetical protein